MKYVADILAQRYVRAFYTVYGAQLDQHDIVHIKDTAEYVHTHKASLALLMLPHATIRNKEKMMDLLLQPLGSTLSLLQPLVRLLIIHQRSRLIGLVLQAIVSYYHMMHAIECFKITTSHAVEEHELKMVRSFLERQTNNTIEIEYARDQSLIAGIRMQSDAHIWEYSVRKQLQALQAAHIA